LGAVSGIQHVVNSNHFVLKAASQAGQQLVDDVLVMDFTVHVYRYK